MPTDTATGLVLRRTFDAARDRVFDAWTSPAMLREFLAPPEGKIGDVAIDLRPGGKYHIEVVHDDGDVWTVRGVYREVRRPERIVCTWGWDEDDPSLRHETLLTLEFLERSGKTELVLTHERFRDQEQRDNHEGGWSKILQQLDRAFAPFTISGIDMSGYMVKDAPRAIAFYRDALGLEPDRVYPEDRGAEYDLADGTTFGLWGGGGQSGIPFQPSNGVLFAVDDFGKAVAAIKARGVPLAMELDLPNCRMAMVLDPEGNTVTLHKRKTAG